MPEDDMVRRYCPECGAKAKGDAHTFETPQKCPACGKLALFIDPFEDTELELDSLDTLLNKNLRPFNTVAIIVVLLASALIIFGEGNLLIAGALGCLIAGVLFGSLYFNQRAAVASLRERRVKFDELRARYEALKGNFDAIIREEKEALDASQRKMAERLAEEHDLKMISASEREEQAKETMQAVDFLGKRFLKDTAKWIKSKLRANNYAASKDRLVKAIESCRKAQYHVSSADEQDMLDTLKADYEMVLRADFEKQEQARIKARIREEQKVEKEIEREIAKAEAERTAIEKALKKALEQVKDEHDAQIEALRAKLTEAEAKAQHAKSMAQQTKAGHVYVISNIGSFGDNVFKIGVSRRLQPLDRVRELGDASVPFPFDVHMMIHSDDAPALETALHKEFHRERLNKVNLRKEFFRVDVHTIRRLVEKIHGEVSYTADAEALEYRQSIEMSEQDFDFVSEKMKEIGGDEAFEDA